MEELNKVIIDLTTALETLQNEAKSFLETIKDKELDPLTRLAAAETAMRFHCDNELFYTFLPKIEKKEKELSKKEKEMVQQILNQCVVVDECIIKLPEIKLDRATYTNVAKALEGIGGKWKGGKIMGFVFQIDPTERLAQIKGGEKINLKKQFQFFGTPTDLADELVELAEIKDTDSVLEPSAGQGAIIEAIRRKNNECYIDAFELMPDNFTILNAKSELKGGELWFQSWETDFLHEASFPRLKCKYHKIIANPPFSKNQDIEHVQAMYECLKIGGKIVTIMSTHWQDSKNKQETDFRDWLKSLEHQIIPIESGAFKSSGTNVKSCIVIIQK